MTKEEQALFVVLLLSNSLLSQYPTYFNELTVRSMASRQIELINKMEKLGFEGNVEELIQSLFIKTEVLH